MNNRLYVDLHVLQTVPPSCVNRDDTGSPKTAIYGGMTRARVSSQAWKRAMRVMFREELLQGEQVGQRTKKVLALLKEEMAALDGAEHADKLAVKALENAGLKLKAEDLDALFFISKSQLHALAVLAIEGNSDKNAYKQALRAHPSMDMILFGRMAASDPTLNYDAAAQVAHSISTHAVQNEYDYFTAVDDCSPEDNAGAGHLGIVEYNSATLYRYATVAVPELVRYLGKNDAIIAVRAFVDAFIRSMPTGKQNTFANRTLPDAVYITVRTDQPVNLCRAFEKAVKPTADGFVAASEQKLCSYAKQVYHDFVDEPAAAFTVGSGLEELALSMPRKEMLDALCDTITEMLTEDEVE